MQVFKERIVNCIEFDLEVEKMWAIGFDNLEVISN